jgi:hypothetical protein
MINGLRDLLPKIKDHQIHSNPLNWLDHQAIPYCRPCGQFHEESTCQVFLQLCDEMGPYRVENEQVNMFGHEYNVSMYDWMDLMEHSEGVNSM